MSEPLYRLLWAKSKPHHFLWRHLLDVAAVAEALWPRFGRLEDMPLRWAAYLCALHDIGKADPWFQNKDDNLAKELNEAGLAIISKEKWIDDKERKFRHEARSSDWLIGHLETHGWREAANVAAAAIRGHHGDFAASAYPERQLEQQRAIWGPLREELATEVRNVLQLPAYAPQAFKNVGAIGVALSGLLIIADWIASNADIYDYTKLKQTDPAAYHREACDLARDVIAKLSFDAPPRYVTLPAFREVWPRLAETARPGQLALEQELKTGRLPPGLAIIEASMGEGKTESAVYLAECWNYLHGTSGMYLALPTQATSNQIHKRFAAYLDAQNAADAPRLVHGMAWLIDDDSPDHGAYVPFSPRERNLSREWFRPMRRALLARDGVGTIDQALMAALQVKFGVLRLTGLRTKVLVIDECHAYDTFMTTIMERLLRWCRALEIPVILLSATLSSDQKKRLVAAYGGDTSKIACNAPYPLLTHVSPDETKCIELDAAPRQIALQIQLHYGFLDEYEAIARHALKRIEDGGCACVLMNSVKGAQQVYHEIELLTATGEYERPDDLGLFHARFIADRRAKTESAVERCYGKEAFLGKGRPQRGILVSTQVVEQSLDVDFDVFITQLAPVDLLLQRSGRLWRHDRLGDRPKSLTGPLLDILLPPAGSWEFGVSEKIYARAILLRTVAALDEVAKAGTVQSVKVDTENIISLPVMFRPLIEAVYGANIPQGSVPRDEIERATEAWEKKRREEQNAAKTNLLPTPSADAFEWTKHAKDEADEGAAKNYLHATTRLGDDSRAALVIDDQELLTHCETSLVDKSKPPCRDVLKKLFGRKVNVPGWWVSDKNENGYKAAAAGFAELFEGANWLRGHIIIPLRDGVWRDSEGNEIRNDATLGLTWTAAAGTGEGEADAGGLG